MLPDREGILTGLVEPHFGLNLNTMSREGGTRIKGTTPGPAPRVPILLRAVILGLHWWGGMTFKLTGKLLGVKERTAGNIIHRATG